MVHDLPRRVAEHRRSQDWIMVLRLRWLLRAGRCRVVWYVMALKSYVCSTLTPISDVAILMMSLHMSLQVFQSTSSRFGPDGLYRFRYAVYIIWILLPSFMAGLAFVQGGRGSYLSQGAFCTLPIRPFWYRLALSWIPRYLVWIYITFTALRIYFHVGSGFSVFAKEVDSATNPSDLSSRPSTTDALKPLAIPRKRSVAPGQVNLPHINVNTPACESLATPQYEGEMDYTYGEKSPTDPTPNPFAQYDSLAPTFPTQAAIPPRRPSVFSQSKVESGPPPTDFGSPVIIQSRNNSSASPIVKISSTADVAAKCRRRAIQRQTRLLFIYPCVYMILMVIPFIQHCFSYSDYFAQHPIFPVSLLGSTCYAIMGTVDCAVFCWREQPWKSIPGSDGTFLGSLKFWRLVGPLKRDFGHRTSLVSQKMVESPELRQVETNDTTGSKRKRFLARLPTMRPQTRRTFSGNNPRAIRMAEHAAERLALERAAAMEAQRRSYLPSEHSASAGAQREWWDRRESWDEIEEEDNEGGDEDEDEKKRKESSVGTLSYEKRTSVV